MTMADDKEELVMNLDDLFETVRRQGEPMPDGLTARVLADAAAVQSEFAKAPQVAAAPGLWQQLLSAVGGWPAMGGLATACAAGLWLGFAPPLSLPDPVQLVQQSQSDLDLFFEESMYAALTEEG